MNRLALAAILSALVLLGAAVGWVAWRRWPPLLDYRIKRIDVQSQDLIRRYFADQGEFEPTASALAILYRHKTELVARLPVDVAPGSVSLTAITLPKPDEVPANDPRLVRLGERMMALALGPEAWERLQRMQREHRGGT